MSLHTHFYMKSSLPMQWISWPQDFWVYRLPWELSGFWPFEHPVYAIDQESVRVLDFLRILYTLLTRNLSRSWKIEYTGPGILAIRNEFFQFLPAPEHKKIPFLGSEASFSYWDGSRPQKKLISSFLHIFPVHFGFDIISHPDRMTILGSCSPEQAPRLTRGNHLKLHQFLHDLLQVEHRGLLLRIIDLCREHQLVDA